MKRKKIAILLLITCLITGMSLMTSCNNTEDPTKDLSAKLDSKLNAYKTDLQDSADTMNSNKNIRNYLTSWAKEKGISYNVDKAGNVIMTSDAGKGYKEVAPTVILCSYDESQFSSYIDPIVMALYTIKNNESTGKLTVIFTAENGHSLSGVKSLSSSYFTDDTNVFCINSGQKGLFATKTGASSSYRSTQSISYTTPTLTKAYKISMTGLPGGQPDSKTSDMINPITRMSSLLSSLKSSGISYQLASINGGDDDDLYAKSASMTIVIDANKEESFIEKMDKATEKFNEKNKDEFKGIKYSYKKVSMPSKVISTSDCNRFVSFMYTLLDGVYYKDDDGNLVSITNISSIKTTDSSIRIGSVAYSLDKANLKEIDTGEETLCNLSGISYKKTSSIPLWEGKSDTKFTTAVAAAYKDYVSQTLTYSDSVPSSLASYIAQKNSKCDIISITVNDNVVKDCTGALVTYLIDTNQKDK
ncbi:MAG: aminoacyl-histidine dipeptidase [Clostridiales bacterium]|nr:aminoacyl-histidine dipeptidase [Clostridiales bacterium]